MRISRFKGVTYSHIKILTAIVFLASLITMVLSGMGNFANDIDRQTRNMRYHNTEKMASGEIVLIRIGDKSIKELGSFPWPRRVYGEMLDAILQQSSTTTVTSSTTSQGSATLRNSISSKPKSLPVGVVF